MYRRQHRYDPRWRNYNREVANAAAIEAEKKLKQAGKAMFKGLCIFVTVGVAIFWAGLISWAGTVLTENSNVDTDAHERFNVNEAHEVLENIVSFGPRVVGSNENEVEAVQYLMKRLVYLSHKAINGSAVYLKFDLQKATGCFNTTLKGFNKISCYNSIQNVVAMIPSIAYDADSVLVNCHFDSVPHSPGASDNGLNCAIMMEAIRLLLERGRHLQRNVIFLFNGAEETGLQGSHAFVTQHRWAKSLKMFVNLDACGAGGRPILFRVGNSYDLIQFYASSVPYPHGNVIAEELFETGLIPSDTDYRIFRDFGNIKGFDIAHYANGYVYHTNLDNLDHTNAPTIQHSGDNLIELLRRILYSPGNIYTYDVINLTPIYFDFFGYKMIYMSNWTFVLMSRLISLCSVSLTFFCIVSVGIKSNIETMTKCMGHVLIVMMFIMFSFVLPLLWNVLVSSTADLFNVPMLWYTTSNAVIFMYGIPAVFVSTAIWSLYHPNFSMRVKHRSERVLFILFTMHFTLSLVYFLLLFLPYRSSYVIGLQIFLFSPIPMAFAIYSTLKNIHSCITTGDDDPDIRCGPFIAAYLLASLCYKTYLWYLINQFYVFIIPIFGRIGNDTFHPDLILGSITSIIFVYAFMFFTPLVNFFRNPSFEAMKLCTICSVIIAASFTFMNLSPYTVETPERFIALHATRKSGYGEHGPSLPTENAYVIYPMDYHGYHYLRQEMPEIRVTHIMTKQCAHRVYCGSPIINAYKGNVLWYEVDHAPSLPPHSLRHTASELEEESDYYIQKIEIFSKGASYKEFLLSPVKDVELLEWSFNATVETSHEWNQRKVYYISSITGLPEEGTSDTSTFNFSFTIKFPVDTPDVLLDVIGIYHYKHNTPIDDRFAKFLSRFPSYMNVVYWNVAYEEYIIQRHQYDMEEE